MPPEEVLRLAAGLVGGYLLGSIPASFLIARWGFGVDLRTVGSGNVGATNALRALGPKAGVPALLLDSLKGTAAVLLAGALASPGMPVGKLSFQMLCGVAAILGHTFTIFLGFKGGKGVATAAGVFGALAPLPLALTLVVFTAVVAATRYVSAGSIAGALALPIFLQLVPVEGRGLLTGLAVPLALFIVYRHRENLRRLAAGTETRLTFGKPAAPAPAANRGTEG